MKLLHRHKSQHHEAAHRELQKMRFRAQIDVHLWDYPMYRVLSALGRQPRLVSSAIAYLKDRWPEWRALENPVERRELMQRDWKLLVLLCQDDSELAAEALGLSAIIFLLDENGNLDLTQEGEAEYRLQLSREIDALPFFESYFLRTADAWDLMDQSV